MLSRDGLSLSLGAHESGRLSQCHARCTECRAWARVWPFDREGISLDDVYETSDRDIDPLNEPT